MRGLKLTMFVLGCLVMGTQTFRHVYVKWLEPRGSFLDAYKDKAEQAVHTSEDLDDLKERYVAAVAKRRDYEGSNPEVEVRQRSARQLYDEEGELRSAIERIEAQQKSIHQLWFFWLCGLGSVGLGILAYRRLNRWLGLVGMITGFSEMACWTSPLWRTWGPQGEFERLLLLKLVLSVVSLALLVGLWLRAERHPRPTPS
jgi:hypothetical protein